MNSRWLLLLIPSAFLAVFTIQFAQAFLHFKFIPQYGETKDADFCHVEFFLDSIDGGISSIATYLVSPFVMLLWLGLLLIPFFCFRGKGRTAFYSLAGLMTAAYSALIVFDVTGFICWYLD